MNPTPAPSREDLIKLREQGLSRDEIAEHYKVSLSKVKRWIKELDVPPPVRPRGLGSKEKIPPRIAVVTDDGMTLTEKARIILGKRMSQDYRGYLLDGRPVRVDVLMRAAGLMVPE